MLKKSFSLFVCSVLFGSYSLADFSERIIIRPDGERVVEIRCVDVSGFEPTILLRRVDALTEMTSKGIIAYEVFKSLSGFSIGEGSGLLTLTYSNYPASKFGSLELEYVFEGNTFKTSTLSNEIRFSHKYFDYEKGYYMDLNLWCDINLSGEVKSEGAEVDEAIN